ncbi:MAG: DUF5615 family PIN-like protein [Planctomycetaceae bacterium]|nr:DUF5615 family PIN-like protein [Planctomycetaceae bacterium]
MAIRFLLDENFRWGALWHAILRQAESNVPIDVVRVADIPELPPGTPDPQILAWAETHGRLVVSLDKATMPTALLEHVASGRTSPGVVLLRGGLTIPAVVELLVFISHASTPDEWLNDYRWIP